MTEFFVVYFLVVCVAYRRHQLSLASDASTKSQARIKRLESDLYTIRNQIKDREGVYSCMMSNKV